MDSTEKCRLMADSMRRDILKMGLSAGNHGIHLGGSLSAVEILAVLYGTVMKINVTEPTDINRDRFIMSKGHGAAALYAALAETGLIQKEELVKFESGDSYLAGHPVRNPEHGIEFTTGSLGMGLSIGAGVAIGAKMKHLDFMTYVLVGDGECDEGAVWEAAMACVKFNLDNLCLIVDKNGFQLGGKTDDIMKTDSLQKRFSSFGWETSEIDGHDINALINAFSRKTTGKPYAVIADTIKGKGIKFAEGNNEWHHKQLSRNQYEEAMKEMNGGE